jgi:hypothetical protein
MRITHIACPAILRVLLAQADFFIKEKTSPNLCQRGFPAASFFGGASTAQTAATALLVLGA